MSYIEQRVSTADRDRAQRWMRGGLGDVRARPGLDHVDGYRVGDDRFQLGNAFVAGALEIEVRRSSVMVLIADGRVEWRGSGAWRHVERGPVLLAGRTRFSLRMRDVASRWLVVDAQELERFARRVYGDPRLAVRFSGDRPLSPETSEFWSLSFDLAAQHAAVGALSDELIRTRILRAMVIATLEAFPLVADRARLRSSAIRLLAVHEAGARFLRDFAALPISLYDAADAAQATVQELVQAFQAHDDGQRTPGEYLLGERLAAARDDLAARDASRRGEIDAVGDRWQLGESRRWAGRYRRRFGETPRQTLAR